MQNTVMEVKYFILFHMDSGYCKVMAEEEA